MRKNYFLLATILLISIVSFGQKENDDLPETLRARLSRTQAEFPGGSEKMKRFIDKQKRYQNKDHERYGAGIVVVGFIVEKDGHIDSIEILQPLIEYYNNEAIRIIKAMPKWKPASQNGEPLRTQFSFPIKF